MIQLAWLIPLLPLIGFTIIGFGGKKLSKSLVSIVGCGSILAAFILSLGVFFSLHGETKTVKVIDWIVTKKTLPTSKEIFPVVADNAQQYFKLWGVS